MQFHTITADALPFNARTPEVFWNYLSRPSPPASRAAETTLLLLTTGKKESDSREGNGPSRALKEGRWVSRPTNQTNLS